MCSKRFIISCNVLVLVCVATVAVAQGMYFDTVYCEHAPEQKYALYSPKNYNGQDELPVIFFFEPGARATLPLTKYRALADKYNLHLACSWNAKNGSVEGNQIAADAMITDVFLHYAIDTSSILLSGFSGGARFCYRYGNENRFVKGVIACGAGLDEYSHQIVIPRFLYTTLVGVEDFNFYELYQLKRIFEKVGMALPFFAYQGKHEWPDEQNYERALCLQLRELGMNAVQPDGFERLETIAANDARDEEDYLMLAWSFMNMASFSAEQNHRLQYRDSLTFLRKESKYKKAERKFNRSLQIEDSLRREIQQATYAIYLTTYNQFDAHKNINWWKLKLKKLAKYVDSGDVYEKRLANRLIDLISVSMWEMHNRLMNEQFYSTALECSEVLLLIDNSNPHYLILKAESLARSGSSKEVNEIINRIELEHPDLIPYLQSNIHLKGYY